MEATMKKQNRESENSSESDKSQKVTTNAKKRTRSGTSISDKRLKTKQQRMNSTGTTDATKSGNAFINFVKEFKQKNTELQIGKNLFRTCGEKWRSLTDLQRQPYIEEAKLIRLENLKNDENTSDEPSSASVKKVGKSAPTKRAKSTSPAARSKQAKIAKQDESREKRGTKQSVNQKATVEEKNEETNDSDSETVISGDTPSSPETSSAPNSP